MEGGMRYSEIVHHPMAGDLLTANRAPLTATPLWLLPQTSWWKLFIDRKYHSEAGPALLFDRQKSKGFHAVMMRVFRSELGLAGCLHRRLDFAEYERLYHAVSDDVGGIVHRGRSGKDAPVGATNFPTVFVPSAAALREMMAENVGHWDIVARIDNQRPTDKVLIMHYGSPPQWICHVGYTMAEAPTLADHFFARYYNEIQAAAGGPLAQARAIAKLVRVLHVYHFFRDANGRLNTMVVLNKLLMENGFPPAIVSDPAIFGGARTIDELVDDIAAGMKTVLAEMEAQLRLSHLDLAT
jgi:hypothetical protein